MRPSKDVSGHVVAEGMGKPYYVLLLGSDSRDEEGEMARSDSIVLCRVDEGAKQVSLVSLPRDLRVEIAGHGTGKLNSALAYEGPLGAIDAVSELTGIQISYYACIYFSGFEGIVDSLGGVDVEVPEGTYYEGVRVPAGDNVHINGEQALVLARCRHGDPPDQGAYAAGDYQRTLNQRNLLQAMAKKILNGNPLAVPFFMTSLAGCVESNMPPAKMAWLALGLRGMDSSKMYSASAPATDAYIGGVSYQILSADAWASMRARLEAGEDPAG